MFIHIKWRQQIQQIIYRKIRRLHVCMSALPCSSCNFFFTVAYFIAKKFSFFSDEYCPFFTIIVSVLCFSLHLLSHNISFIVSSLTAKQQKVS